jgi:hypothetical protein
MSRIIAALVLLFSPIVLTQVKYAVRDQRVIATTLEYSRLDNTTIGGIQFSFSPDGRIDFGLGGAIASSPSRVKAATFFADIALLKSSRPAGGGFNLLVALSRAWQPSGYFGTEYSYATIATNSEFLGLECYFPLKNTFAIPFFQIGKTFSNTTVYKKSINNSLASFSVGSDFIFGESNRPWVILTPGAVFNEKQQPALVAQLSVVIDSRMRVK